MPQSALVSVATFAQYHIAGASAKPLQAPQSLAVAESGAVLQAYWESQLMGSRALLRR